MKRTKNKRVPKRPDRLCDPALCDYCMYIGEGDFICDSHPLFDYVMVMSDWEPTVYYQHCIEKAQCVSGGKKK